MSVYVGIDVHRKRSQVAVVAEDGQVQLNKNVVNGSEPMLRLIGDLPPGTPVASGAAFGWSWLARLLEDYGFEAHMVHPLRCKAIASARLKNDKVDAAILAQLLRADLLPEARGRLAVGAGLPGVARVCAHPHGRHAPSLRRPSRPLHERHRDAGTPGSARSPRTNCATHCAS